MLRRQRLSKAPASAIINSTETVRTMEDIVAKFRSEGKRRGYIAIVLVLLTTYALISVHFYSDMFQKKTVAETQQKDPKNSNTLEQDCLSLDLGSDMDNLLSKYKQVFIEMPAKAAGQTLKFFTTACMATTNASSFAQHPNLLNSKLTMEKAFASQLKMPSLVASHIYEDVQPMHDTMIHATEETLIIYSYRDETERVMSAIKHVVSSRNCTEPIAKDQCLLNEEKLLHLIRIKFLEIRFGITQHLTCKTYEVIKDNNPNLVFMHYKKASQLQKLLAKHHCPEVTKDFRENAAELKRMNVTIVLEGQSNNGTLVSLEDWLDAKRQLMELIFVLRKNASCQATTKDIQHKLMRCPDNTLQLSGRSFEDHKVMFPF